MLATSMHTTAPHSTAALAEADRLMVVCNSCRYCEGLCAVFPAMEMRRIFQDGDLNYLANLCHSCGACYFDCQFSPPHEFEVNVPRALAEVRNDSYRAYAWPRALSGLFARNGLAVSLIAAVSVTCFVLSFVALHDPSTLLSAHAEPGSFYRLMPHNAMALLFGGAFLYALVAIAMGAVMFWRDIDAVSYTHLDVYKRQVLSFVALHDPSTLLSAHAEPGSFYRLMPHNAMALLFGGAFLYALVAIAMGAVMFWRDIDEPASALGEPGSWWQACKDAGGLRYLDGGAGGCMNEDERPTDRRKLYHHATFYGFMLCFAATCTATVYHYLFGREAPYVWYDLPVVLGTIGGAGLIVGPLGLLAAKIRRSGALVDESRLGMDVAFLAMLFLTSLSGLALLCLRNTPAMGILLALHLGVVFALFLTMPYGKFVHGLYRFLALVRYARERRSQLPTGE